ARPGRSGRVGRANSRRGGLVMRRFYRKYLAPAVAALLVMAAFIGSIHGAALAQRRFVTLASGWVVGVYYPIAGALSRVVYDANIGIRLTVESSGASAAN